MLTWNNEVNESCWNPRNWLGEESLVAKYKRKALIYGKKSYRSFILKDKQCFKRDAATGIAKAINDKLSQTEVFYQPAYWKRLKQAVFVDEHQEAKLFQDSIIKLQ